MTTLSENGIGTLPTTPHDGYVQLQNGLNSSDGLPRLLGIIDDSGHGAVSINNPDTAKRIATFVPGSGQDLARCDASDVSVTTWRDMTGP